VQTVAPAPLGTGGQVRPHFQKLLGFASELCPPTYKLLPAPLGADILKARRSKLLLEGR
jgi:hypothetical protein